MATTNQRPALVKPSQPQNQAVAKMTGAEAGGASVAAFFEGNRDSIKAVLPQHMTPDRMLKIALRALRTTPKLMQCNTGSLFGAVITCAQLGLEPNTPQGHIYLIPFENRRKQTTEVQVIIGYKGLIDLARRSGEIISISSHAVRERDVFDVDFGTEERVIHKPQLTGLRGDIIGFYAVAKLTGGGTQFEFMTVDEVNAIRDGSQGYQSAKRFAKNGAINSPWATNYEEMGRKTVIRRLCKYLPMSVEMASAVSLDGKAETGASQGLGGVLDGDFTVMPDDAPVDDGRDESVDPETGEVIEDRDAGNEPPPPESDEPQADTRPNSQPPVNGGGASGQGRGGSRNLFARG